MLQVTSTRKRSSCDWAEIKSRRVTRTSNPSAASPHDPSLITLLTAGHGLATIAFCFGIDPSWVLARVAALGLETPHTRPMRQPGGKKPLDQRADTAAHPTLADEPVCDLYCGKAWSNAGICPLQGEVAGACVTRPTRVATCGRAGCCSAVPKSPSPRLDCTGRPCRRVSLPPCSAYSGDREVYGPQFQFRQQPRMPDWIARPSLIGRLA